MAVYVDDAMIPAKLGRWPAKWSHLTADSDEELMAFAAVLGLKPEWFQVNGLGRIEANHFDVTMEVRKSAIELGAIPETMREGARRRRAATHERLANGS